MLPEGQLCRPRSARGRQKKWSKGHFFTILTIQCGKIIIFTKNLRFAMGVTRKTWIFLRFGRKNIGGKIRVFKGNIYVSATYSKLLLLYQIKC